MTKVLLATDSDEIAEETFAALVSKETTVSRVKRGEDVREIAQQLEPDLVILDLQIGNMGGVAACLEVRLESRAERIPIQKVFLLLDREADIFLAKEADADGWFVKPIDPLALQRLVTSETINQ